MTWLVRAVLVAAMSIGSMAVTGCEREPHCEKMDDREHEGSGVTVLLADVSASVRGAGSAPDYTRALQAQVGSAVERGDMVYVGSFDGSSSTVEWTAEHKLTHSDANRSKNQRRDREDFTTCLERSVRAATTSPARTGGSDVLAAIDVASRTGRPSGTAGRTVVVATDGLSTAGCLDLTGGGAGRAGWIDTVLEECPDRPGWPGDMVDTSLTMVGIGHPSAGRNNLTSADVSFLGSLWQRVCETAEAAVCGVSTLPVPRADATGASTAADPEVRFTPGAGAPEPKGPISFRTDSLFAVKSAEILPAGRQRLIQWAGQYPGASSVQVIGHADIRDSEAENDKLAKDRATAVARVLTGAGMTGVSSRGEGERNASCKKPKLPGGAWNEECLQRDRRVDVIVTTSEG